ncbi:Fe(3+)-hydroxamate ABC transporter permease FhuB [Rhizobium paknamense]|uniref:Iron complex transport system permease protein n=1 Tax=Rhizobium paknamense TaxID=1206817 RepID=A0ABU0IFQ0_9HYPH|nr:Fe(3+)-hydroxamate ABC transporter permease FhuB [Rhizobium paknamense]MDQ0457081.1 iron complex transport system permease protein [Rhizobium paknamense]
MTALASHRLPVLVTLLLAALGLVLAGMLIGPQWPLLFQSGGYDIDRMVLVYSTLPRMATALISGAALALSGALFQQVLRNPLASPTTLGISAGANLAIVIAMLWFPALLGLGRDLVALIGSGLAAGLVFLLGARRSFSPFSLVMAGLIISLWCGALSAVLMLLHERYLVSLFIWGAGSLSQQSFAIPLALLPKVGLVALLAALILRPLTVIDLGEAGAKGVGLNTTTLRFCAVTLAVALAAFVTSAVGVIGFIGLVSPTLARLAGARRPAALLIWASLIGAFLLFFADCALMLLAGSFSDLLPTGAVTAVFGSPLLLLLLPRLKVRHRVMTQTPRHRAGWRWSRRGLIFALMLLMLLIGVALFVGRLGQGEWALLTPDLWQDILPLRLPRSLAGFAAGAMLAVAGVILQRLTGNEMASPEVLGISAGATFGVTLGLFFFTALSLPLQIGFAAAGAFAILGLIFLFAIRSGLAPERVLLAGIALSAMVDAVVGVLGATGDPRAIFLMRWMSGSTYMVDLPQALTVAAAACLLVLAALASRRWLDLLPLGPEAARALGVPLKPARLLLLMLAGLLSAVATLSVGPLSFVGLMAPHLAREAGLTRAVAHMAGAALIGGVLMMMSDWAGRMIVYPYEIPAGIVSALIGAPFLILLMRRR